MKLIDFWTIENDKQLTQMLWDVVMNYSGGNIPSYLEVKDFLKTTDVESFNGYGMIGDLSIRFEMGEFQLEIL